MVAGCEGKEVPLRDLKGSPAPPSPPPPAQPPPPQAQQPIVPGPRPAWGPQACGGALWQKEAGRKAGGGALTDLSTHQTPTGTQQPPPPPAVSPGTHMAAVREAPAPPRPQAPPSKPQEETRQVCSSWGQGVLTTPQPCFASPPGGLAQTHLGPPRGPSPLWGQPPLPSTGSQARLLGDPHLGRAEGTSPSSVSCHTHETREESPALGEHAETLVGPRARPALSPSGRLGSTGLGHSLLSLGSMRPTPEGPMTSPGCWTSLANSKLWPGQAPHPQHPGPVLRTPTRGSFTHTTCRPWAASTETKSGQSLQPRPPPPSGTTVAFPSQANSPQTLMPGAGKALPRSQISPATARAHRPTPMRGHWPNFRKFDP